MLIVIPREVMWQRLHLPPAEVAPYINQQVWFEVVDGYHNAGKDALCMACAIEVSVTLCLGCFCIFCCHPLIERQIVRNNQSNRMTTLNNIYFFGERVISVSEEGSLVINTQLIHGPTQMSTVYLPPAQVSPVSPDRMARADAGGVLYPAHVASSGQGTNNPLSPPVAVASPVGPTRYMSVTIPAGVRGGDVLTVRSPEGLEVSLKVPKNVEPGMTMQVEY